MNKSPDFTKLFSIIDSIVCGLVECRDEKNTLYILTAGYIGNQILLKLDTEDYAEVYRFEFTSPRQAMQRAEWIVSEKQLCIKVISYYYDNSWANISTDFYRGNQVQYTFDGRCRVGGPIKMSYRLCIDDINVQELCDSYTDFKRILSQNQRGYGVVEVSPNPNKLLRKSKLEDLLAD